MARRPEPDFMGMPRTVEPHCPYFAACGGCTAQHVTYEAQLEAKRLRLASLLAWDEVQVVHGEPYGYRCRMDFVFHPTGLGLREQGRWWKIVDVEECAIASSEINALLREVRGVFHGVDVFDVKRRTGTFRYAVLRATARESSVSIVLNQDSSSLQDAVERVRVYASSSRAAHVVVARVPPRTDVSFSSEYTVLKGSEALVHSFLGRTFAFPIQGFFQNNLAVAERMQEMVRGWLTEHTTRDAHLLDLYAGVGTFGIVNADLFRTVTCVESFAESVAYLRRNVEANSVGNLSIYGIDARELARVPLERPLVVVTDPPRAGMHPKTLKRLVELDPDVIFYVSCNPSRLREEVAALPGHGIKRVALVDLFPQTPHMEALVELVRK